MNDRNKLLTDFKYLFDPFHRMIYLKNVVKRLLSPRSFKGRCLLDPFQSFANIHRITCMALFQYDSLYLIDIVLNHMVHIFFKTRGSRTLTALRQLKPYTNVTSVLTN